MASRKTGMDNDITGETADGPHTPVKDGVADNVDIALTIEDDRWAGVLGAEPTDLVFPAVIAALAAGRDRRRRATDDHAAPGRSVDGSEISLGLTFTDDSAIRSLNRDYRGRDSATNVLSFAFQDGEALPQPEGAPIELGDLVLAYDTILREADLQGRSVRHHLLHLIVHGVLHLLGYDHMTDNDAAEMESLEIEILRGLSIPNPYETDSESTPYPESTPYEEDTPAASRADGLP